MKSRTFVNENNGRVSRVRKVRSKCGKYAYSSRKLAAAAAKTQTRNTGELIEHYKCKRGCHAWHIGHPIGSVSEARKSWAVAS